MKNFGRSNLAAVLENNLVFRKLKPLNPDLPGLGDLRTSLGIPSGTTPRKIEPAYGRVVAQILNTAFLIDHPGQEIDNLIYIGDTPGSDRTAFLNICRAGNWPGLVFIGNEKTNPAKLKVKRQSGLWEAAAEKWSDIQQLEDLMQEHQIPLGRRTAVIVDIDKTMIGARGRNDHTLNQARIQAVQHTLANALGSKFEGSVFENYYQEINQDRYHFLSEDNQDLVAYICLVLCSEIINFQTFKTDLQDNKVPDFWSFLKRVDQKTDAMSENFRRLHENFRERFEKGDPTPFKEFRREEYRQTMQRLGYLPDDCPPEELLEKEIVITSEVYQLLKGWKEDGLLVFGLSDKPDEATLPKMESSGQLPIHLAATHLVGTADEPRSTREGDLHV